jgi:folate-binding Fe-S cluster repair protein YgfZ
MDLSAQNLLGYRPNDIKKYMKENQETMEFQSLTFNNTFKYAKYADKDGNQTTLFFFTADSICKGIRMICDKSIEPAMIKDLDSKYKKTANNTWTESKNGTNYIIELREEEWSFNVTISKND